MKATKIIRWTNKCSHEQGYVKKINHKAGYFENTFERDEARHFLPSLTPKALEQLNVYCGDNTYEAIDA